MFSEAADGHTLLLWAGLGVGGGPGGGRENGASRPRGVQVLSRSWYHCFKASCNPAFEICQTLLIIYLLKLPLVIIIAKVTNKWKQISIF